MNLTLFALALLASIIGPVLAVTYLKPILEKVLTGLCDASGGAEFWIRCAYLLAVCGSLLLTLTFGLFDERTSAAESLRRTLWLVSAGIFFTVALISRNVWSQVRSWLAQNGANRPAPAPSE